MSPKYAAVPLDVIASRNLRFTNYLLSSDFYTGILVFDIKNVFVLRYIPKTVKRHTDFINYVTDYVSQNQ